MPGQSRKDPTGGNDVPGPQTPADHSSGQMIPVRPTADLLAVLDSLGDLVFVFDTGGRFQWVFLPSSEPPLYAKPDQFLQKHFREILPRDVADTLAGAFDKIRGEGGVQHFDYSLPLPGGEAWFEARVAALRDPGGSVSGFSAVVHNATEQKVLENKLLQEHQQLLSIFDSIDEPIYVSDPDTYEVLFVNRAMRSILGQVVGQKCHVAFQGLLDPCPFCTNDRIFGDNAGTPYIWEFRNRGNRRWYRCIDRAIGWPDGRTVRYEMAIDITERKLARNELAKEKEQLAVTLASIGDGVIATDPEGCVVLMNPVAEKLTGWNLDEAAGQPLATVFRVLDRSTGEPVENIFRDIATRKRPLELGTDTILADRSGARREITDSGTPIETGTGDFSGVVVVFRDVKEERQLEKERLRAQNMESLGVLAGGIAHDFNNILTAILGNVSLARESVGQGHEAYERLDQAERACNVAQGLAKQLLTFSKGGSPIKQPSSHAALLRDASAFATRGSNVRCEIDLSENLWPVEVDRGQIQQCLNNLIINAVQAMPRGGVVRIRAENVHLHVPGDLPLEPGPYVKTEIEDHGSGIPEQNLSRIFDPYFTTKEQGSGLGLASVFSILGRHGGHVEAKSRPGKGATFTVFVPALENEKIPSDPAPAPTSQGSGRILVMEDEALVRNTVEKMLTRLGYNVTLTRDGPETVEIFGMASHSETPFDLVLLDLTIHGGWGGLETLQVLRRLDPSVKAIVSSGYSNDPVMSEFKEHGFTGVICKPYTMGELSRVLSDALNRATT